MLSYGYHVDKKKRIHKLQYDFLLTRKAATKVVRPRSDRGSRYSDDDRSEETEDQALISAITFLPKMTVVLSNQTCMCESKTTITKRLMIIASYSTMAWIYVEAML